MVQHLTVARIAEGLSVTWNTANDAVLAEGKGPRRTLHTGADLLTDKQKDRLLTLFAADEHVQVEATWTI